MDDDEDFVVALKERLELEGYRVDTAIDGLKALDRLATHRRYDAIVSGLNMPCMNGLDLLKRVRHDYRDMPFILMSASASVERIAEALRLGATTFLPKPYAFKQLMAVISSVRSQPTTISDKAKGGAMMNVLSRCMWIALAVVFFLIPGAAEARD